METRRVIVGVSTKLLEDALGLNPKYRIVDVLSADERLFKPQKFDVIIEGDDLPIAQEGNMYPVATLEKGYTKMRY